MKRNNFVRRAAMVTTQGASLKGAIPYDPPVPPALLEQAQAPEQGLDKSYESSTIIVPWPEPTPPQKLFSVYTTRKRWRAIDVFVEKTDDSVSMADTMLSVVVYGRSQNGRRAVVASGRFGPTTTFGGIDEGAIKWVASARTVSERYEVAIHLRRNNESPALTGQLKVTVVASDEMTEAPPTVGCVLANSIVTSELVWGTGSLYPPPPLELISLWGVVGESVEDPRYIGIVDDNSEVSLSGATASLIFPLGSSGGQGVTVERINWRAIQNPRIAVTSSPVPSAFAPVTDCYFNALVR